MKGGPRRNPAIGLYSLYITNYVRYNIHQSGKGITNVEPSDAPRLNNRTILNRKTEALCTLECLFQIIDLNRYVRNSGA
jgi:hypothetical protein